MNVDVHIIHHGEFLVMTPDGEVDLGESKRILLKIAALDKLSDNRDVLIDLRATQPRLTITNITELVELMINHRNSFRHKLAILTHPGSHHELAEFMELYAGNRGFRVAAFNNFEAAILWLATITDVTLEDT